MGQQAQTNPPLPLSASVYRDENAFADSLPSQQAAHAFAFLTAAMASPSLAQAAERSQTVEGKGNVIEGG